MGSSEPRDYLAYNNKEEEAGGTTGTDTGTVQRVNQGEEQKDKVSENNR